METLIFQTHTDRHAKTKEVIVFIICLACIFLFLTSAYSKIIDHERFTKGLARVPLIGRSASVISWLVPLSEITIALLLIIPKTYKSGLYSFTWLMILFTLYISGMMLWADRLPCHCNLFIEKLSWGQHLIFNTIFIILSISALQLSKKI